MKENPEGGAGGLMTENLQKQKTQIEQIFTELRTVSERANNWSQIEPVFTRLHGGFNNLFVAIES